MAFGQPKSAQRTADKSRAGITLIEVMAAIVIIAIAVLGASAYRYYATLDARKAVLQSTAARIALLLNENWRGRGYDHIADFDPVSHLSSDIAIAASGIGPAYAVPKALKLAGLTRDQIGLVELNEAFASQSLYVIRELGLSMDIVNVNGGAIAMGHPLGCTGAKLTTTLLYEMRKRNIRYGLVTMCIGGGMGAAGVFEKTD